MKTRARVVSTVWGLSIAIWGAGFAAAPSAGAALCHEPWEGHQVCIAVDECHVAGLENPLQPGRPEPLSEPPDVTCFLGPRR